MSSTKSFINSKLLQKKAHQLIPGGCHTYAKGDDQFPEMSPGFIARGKGCHVWDVDDNEFIEYGMGLRAVTLGHAYEPVVKAAYKHMLNGNNFTRPAPIEIECAEIILDVLDNAEQIKFAKDGSTVVSAGLKLARAYTGRDMVAICADHPFFSYNDWFIGTTDLSAGIPDVNRSLTLKFHYNDIKSLSDLFDQYPGKIACVVTEAARTDEPQNNFLKQVQALCNKHGTVFLLDEMITGFRWHISGAQKVYDIQPDLSTFGKALANGFSVSALAGRRDLMELGGLYHDRERVFLLSTTHGAENHSLAAAKATIEIYREQPVIETLYRQGERLKHGVNRLASELGVDKNVQAFGRGCNLVFATKDEQLHPSQSYRALFMQELIKGGVLAPSFVVSYSHTDDDIDNTLQAVGDALVIYKSALEEGTDKYLIGRPLKPVYRKYN